MCRGMDSDSGRTISAWMTPLGPPLRPLDRDMTSEICVVGAGIAGMSIAYQLARAGRKVVVLDDGPVGGGAHGRTTGHLACALDDRFVDLERLHGAEGARLAAESHAVAIDRIEAIVRAE